MFQTGSAQKILIRVWQLKVNPFFTGPEGVSTTVRRSRSRFFSQGMLKIFQSKSAEKFSIKVRLRNENQSLIDPDRFSIAILIAFEFLRLKIDENVSGRVCSKNFNRGPTAKSLPYL